MGQIMDIEPKDGVASQRAYLIQYDEDQWFKYDEAGQQFCKDQWIKKATPMDVDFIVLQLIPDPLFPRGEKEKPYCIWSHTIVRAPKQPFTIMPFVVQILLDKGITAIDVALRRQLEMVLLQYPAGTQYQVFASCVDKPLLEGRVRK